MPSSWKTNEFRILTLIGFPYFYPNVPNFVCSYMREPLLMRAICYDSVLLTDQLSYSFFSDEDDESGDRFNNSVETDIIQWLFKHPLKVTDDLFFQELQIDKSFCPYFEVRKPIIKDSMGPGDIDILLINQNKPQYSVGFQVKKIKASINEEDTAVLKTSPLSKGILQAKWMYDKYRFHQNYLMLVVATDAQRRRRNSQLFRYNKVEEKEVVYEFSGFGDLPDNVGILIVEINQPSINHIDYTATIASKALRLAKPIDQLSDTTSSIQTFLNNGSL